MRNSYIDESYKQHPIEFFDTQAKRYFGFNGLLTYLNKQEL